MKKKEEISPKKPPFEKLTQQNIIEHVFLKFVFVFFRNILKWILKFYTETGFKF